MYIFLMGSKLAFLRVFGYFLFPIGILFFLIDIKYCGLIKIALISH